MGGISWYQLLIVLVIVILVFGTKKLKNVGSDLGEAVKGFKKGIKDEDDKPELTEQKTESTSEKVESKDSEKS
ncbi:MAG TPA: Sec-independent protein translocase subunit TatA [Gammaproteobacteria bacterium]|jgi:sec-independent protein translocase protein TatA|nr:Sec-independent protein translocase subunit TatA [Xanthomonadales bacterium]MCB1593890.1 Sec-independent protein translocase subunit TatA [Xanthomonadales bacterium]HOP21411.1 Sec-independent protein translocase subunit TatA [Gammaproteobacteria bacterium]HPI94679.1 Sec-independent protein translocase subunit TatA [Gammaproteobacteria bacterium]HPQ86124.1 Sec-independent protein translocase subunit TatA [Gammaproteobacteria bacterium]